MRIYTEVNFQWDDKKGKLVEVSSDSFDYSGEMALCWTGGADWWTTNIAGYDHEGNRYTWRRDGDHWQVAISYREDGGFGEPTLIHNDANSDESDAKTAIKDFREETRPADIARTIYSTQSAGLLVYAEGMATAGMSGSDIYDKTGYYQKESTGGEVDADGNPVTEWSILGTDETLPWLEDQDPSDELDLTGMSQEEQNAILGIKRQIDEWERLTTVAGDPLEADTVELLVKGYVSTLKEKESAVRTAYEDIWGEEGSIFDIWEAEITDKERGEEKYTTDIGLAVTEQEEGLEGTVVGREGELEALREEAGGEIRAAEAKIGAAGFASTGVGRTARDILAEEIGGAARDIDEGFTEERSDVKRSYLKKVDPLEKEYGEEGTAYEDYITTRDLAAKGVLSAWETASTAYETAKTRHEEIDMPSAQETYKTAFRDIGLNIMDYIGDIREGVVGDPNEQFNPFGLNAPLSDYSAAQFGIKLDPSSMQFTDIPTDAPMDFYTPYQVDPGLELYDPEKILPWEEGYGGGGGGGTGGGGSSGQL
jgi:hypothetical protein